MTHSRALPPWGRRRSTNSPGGDRGPLFDVCANSSTSRGGRSTPSSRLRRRWRRRPRHRRRVGHDDDDDNTTSEEEEQRHRRIRRRLRRVFSWQWPRRRCRDLNNRECPWSTTTRVSPWHDVVALIVGLWVHFPAKSTNDGKFSYFKSRLRGTRFLLQLQLLFEVWSHFIFHAHS